MKFSLAMPRRRRARSSESASPCLCALAQGPATAHRKYPAWLIELLREAVAEQRDDWRRECVEVQLSFAEWSSAPRPLRARAFAAYCDALEREERASVIYAELLSEARRQSL
ncbi:MAG TPA: hypothetical protein VH025_05085 [Solirubrobacteraceae bacterium]|jgi:hypothetical protein|nr:hypothetical protein [Solirubrobacteraceae bacterium]